MRLMIASDIHGSAYYCRKLIDRYFEEKADRLLLLGDILYHGPRNDLPREYDTKSVISMLNEMKEHIFCVRGNCDGEVDQMVLDFPVLADYCIIPLGSRLIYATHGHKYNMDNPLPFQKGDILLHGHTHVPAFKEFGNDCIYINPGSVSIPKEESEHSYIIINDGKCEFKNLGGGVYDKRKL